MDRRSPSPDDLNRHRQNRTEKQSSDASSPNRRLQELRIRHLLGQASTSEALARMSPSEQVDWCVQGGIAKAFGTGGDRRLAPVILDILRNEQIDWRVRDGILEAIELQKCAAEFKNELMKIARDKIDEDIRIGALKAIGLSGCAAEFKNELIQIACDKKIYYYIRAGALKAIGLSGCASEFKNELMQIACDKKENGRTRKYALKAIGLSGCASEFKNELMRIVCDDQEQIYTIKAALNAIGLSGCAAEFKNELIQIACNKEIDSDICVRALKSIELLGCALEFKNEIAKIAYSNEEAPIANIEALKCLYLSGYESKFKNELMEIACDKKKSIHVRIISIKAIKSIGYAEDLKDELIQIVKKKHEDPSLISERRYENISPNIEALKVIKSIRPDTTLINKLMQIRSDPQTNKVVRYWIDHTLIILNNAPTPSSREASSSRRTGESRSSERRESSRSEELQRLERELKEIQEKMQRLERLQRSVSTSEASSSQRTAPERSRLTDGRTDSRRLNAGDLIGQELGNYHLVDRLGKGGFAYVYLGEHTHLKKTKAAIKVLQEMDSGKLKEFCDEAQILFDLRHPHIVRILDFGVKDKVLPYLVMEYAPNGTLRDAHRRGTRLSPGQIVAYVNQIAGALDYLHNHKDKDKDKEKPLMHLDLKPENVLVRANGEVLLSDFGLVQDVHRTDSQVIPERRAGTAPYMDPEYMLGFGPARPASDQYALGVMVYEWLSGSLPFQGNGNMIAAQHLAEARPESLRGRIAGISSKIEKKIEKVVFKALARNPKDRFKSVTEFAQAFERACRS